jgi:hypothetical protein
LDRGLEEIIGGLPPEPQRSRLAPYAELIAEMRGRGWTYRAIAKVLAEKCGVQVSYRNVHHFVQSRTSTNPTGLVPAKNTRTRTPSDETVGTIREADIELRVAALKLRTSASAAEPGEFKFDSDEPLRLRK